MGFSSKQVAALRRNVEERHVRTRQSANGRELSYVEGWYVISQANRIFGFDGWSRETLESKCVLARENRGSFIAVYTAKVRLTVQADGTAVVREGHGTGEGRGDSPGEVHDTALKAAETDATKRALATFGRPFGLELYRASKSNRAASSAPKEPASLPLKQAPALAAGTAPVFENALPHPDDGTPIPRPSTHYGLEAYLETREARGALVREAARNEVAKGISPPPQAPIDKSILPFGEPKRLRDKGHLKFVASHPCLICGRQPADPHHLRFAQPRAIGLKVSDEFTVPLCRSHHRNLHQAGNELSWWANFGIEPLPIARKLWEETHPSIAPTITGPSLRPELSPSPGAAHAKTNPITKSTG